MSSENYVENGCMHDLDLLIISHQFRVHILGEVGAERKCPNKTHLPYGLNPYELMTG